jgi:HSP20 family protein
MNLSLWKRRSPINGDLARLRDEMDRTFDRFFGDPWSWSMMEPKDSRTESWFPPVDLSETGTEVTIRADVPGIAAKDLDISVSGTTLTIAGQKQEHEEKKGEDFYCSERSFGSFRRMIDLPDTVDADRVTAESDNGVVTIHVAKKPGIKPKQIEVKPAPRKVAVAT